MRRAALALALTAAPAAALAQDAAPWSLPAQGAAPSTAPTTAPNANAAWPALQSGAPAAPVVRAPVRRPVEAGADHHFQLPTARLVRYGDLQAQYVGALGWVGARYGISRVVDVGAGVPYYLVGLTVDARVAFVQREGVAASWWGYVTVPFKPDGETPASNLGFTWAYAAVGWLTGPLVSLWNHRVGVHLGVHAAQRTGLGGVWLVGHATVDVRVHDSVKLIAQGMTFYELAQEGARGARSLLGNGTPRLLAWAIGGGRFHTRRFAVDLGVLVPLTAESPLHSEGLPVLPWMSLSHLF